MNGLATLHHTFHFPDFLIRLYNVQGLYIIYIYVCVCILRMHIASVDLLLLLLFGLSDRLQEHSYVHFDVYFIVVDRLQ